MKISERTVEFHLKNIYEKYQVNSRLELVLKLKNDPNWLEQEDLGESTVAGSRPSAENGDQFNLSNRITSLREAISKFSKELTMNIPLDSTTDNDATQITFSQAIRKCFSKYAEFNGRASRAEFWWFMLFVVLCASVFTLISETAASIFLIAVLLPLLAVGSRRLHDTGRSAWWQLFLLAPVGGLVALGFLWAAPSTDAILEKDRLPA